MARNALYKQTGYMSIMNIDIERLKERIIALVDGCNLPYVIPLLNDLENTIHEHSFDNGYETGYDIGYDDGYEEWNRND